MRSLLLLLFPLSASAVVYSPFTVARSFSEHAVLAAAPDAANVWGWTSPGGVVSTFLNCSAMNITTTFNTTADADGLWVASFPPVPASLHSCVVAFHDAASTASVWYLDILFGFVLLCGGQRCASRRVRARAPHCNVAPLQCADVLRHSARHRFAAPHPKPPAA